jgi:hypothetical protein
MYIILVLLSVFLTKGSLFPDINSGYVVFINQGAALNTRTYISEYIEDLLLELEPSRNIKDICAEPDKPIILPKGRPVYVSDAPLGITGNYSHPTYGDIILTEERNKDSKYQYKVNFNYMLISWISLCDSGSLCLVYNKTYDYSEYLFTYSRDIATNQVNKLHVLFQQGVEPITFVSAKYNNDGFGAYIGIGGTGFAFPLNSTESRETLLNPLHTIDVLSRVNIGLTGAILLLAFLLIILVFVLVCKRQPILYQPIH